MSFKTGDRVLTPAGHPATVTDVRDRMPNVHVRFDAPMRVPGWFPGHVLRPLPLAVAAETVTP